MMNLKEKLIWVYQSEDITDWKLLWINRLTVVLAFLFTFNDRISKRVMVAMLVLWLFRFKKNDFLFLVQNRIFQTALAFILMVGISYFYTNDNPRLSLHYFERFYVHLLLPLLVISLTLRREYFVHVINAFLFAMVIHEVLSYGISFGIWLDYDSDGFPIAFMKHIPYSILVAFTLFLLFFRIKQKTSVLQTAILSLFFVTMLGNLIMSGGRTGQVIFLVGIIYLGIVFYKEKFLDIAKALAIPALVFLVSYNIYEPFQKRIDLIESDIVRSIEEKNFQTSIGNRIGSYLIFSDILKESSIKQYLIGNGYGDIQYVKNKTIDAHYPKLLGGTKFYTQFHNIYMDIFVGLGLVGLALFLAFLINVVLQNINDSEIRYIKHALFITIAIACIPHHALTDKPILWLLALFVGLMTALQREEALLKGKNAG